MLLRYILVALCLILTDNLIQAASKRKDIPEVPLVGDPDAKGGWTYDYSKNGRDFADLVSSTNAINYCGQPNQSPVNLMNRIGSYGWAYGFPYPKDHDDIQLNYKDLTKEKKVEWTGKAQKVDFHEVESEENYFVSKIGPKYFQTTSDKFKAESFMIRSPSEHMVMGKHLDIELQIKHNADQWNSTYNMKYAYVSLLFSVEHYDRSVTQQQNETIRDFWRHIKLGEDGDITVDLISFGRLMEFQNFNNRWVYKGSETFPPCERNVYWNVIAKTLPIEIETFKKFKAWMKTKESEMGGPGNYRIIQRIDNQHIQYVGAKTLAFWVLSLTSVLYSLF